MRVMVIGATGAIGTPLVSQLREAGHEVVGTSRSQERAAHLAPIPSSSMHSTLQRSSPRLPPHGRKRSSTRPPASPGCGFFAASTGPSRRQTDYGPKGSTTY
jgi:hypothetical protein